MSLLSRLTMFLNYLFAAHLFFFYLKKQTKGCSNCDKCIIIVFEDESRVQTITKQVSHMIRKQRNISFESTPVFALSFRVKRYVIYNRLYQWFNRKFVLPNPLELTLNPWRFATMGLSKWNGNISSPCKGNFLSFWGLSLSVVVVTSLGNCFHCKNRIEIKNVARFVTQDDKNFPKHLFLQGVITFPRGVWND